MRSLPLNKVPATYKGSKIYYYLVMNGCLRGDIIKPLWYYQMPNKMYPPDIREEDIDYSTSGEDPNPYTVPWRVMS